MGSLRFLAVLELLESFVDAAVWHVFGGLWVVVQQLELGGVEVLGVDAQVLG